MLNRALILAVSLLLPMATAVGGEAAPAAGVTTSQANAEKQRIATAECRDGRILVGRAEAGNQMSIPVNGGSCLISIPAGAKVDYAEGILPIRDPYRLPPASLIQASIGKSALLKSVQQIPAFVVKDGPLAYVPYQSFRSGDAEINIYGDLAHPCAIEIGLYGSWAKDGAMWRYAADAMARWATLPMDGSTFKIDSNDFMDVATRIDFTAGGQMRLRGMVIDITPSGAPDSFGAWWIGISDPIACAAIQAPPEVTATLLVHVEPTKAAAASPAASADGDSWTTSDVQRTFRATHRPASSGGSCYVRSYTRKDGTFVAGHSRRR